MRKKESLNNLGYSQPATYWPVRAVGQLQLSLRVPTTRALRTVMTFLKPHAVDGDGHDKEGNDGQLLDAGGIAFSIMKAN